MTETEHLIKLIEELTYKSEHIGEFIQILEDEMEESKNEDYEQAIDKFNDIINKFPYNFTLIKKSLEEVINLTDDKLILIKKIYYE
jgi:hypothetical protein